MSAAVSSSSAAGPAASLPAGAPVTELGMVSIGLVASGVIYLTAYLPRKAPLIPAVVLLALAVAVLVASLLLLTRIENFAWWRFTQVAQRLLLVYLVIGGMIEYAFLYDHTHGAVLALLTALLATFVLNVPVIAGFTVARFEKRPRP